MTTTPSAPIRVRFAPSPTGYLHVGSARTALFNWIFARSVNGEMLLRVEDTDTERNRAELTAEIVSMLKWLGVDTDGEIIFQSDNRPRHKQVTEQLLEQGQAYLCDQDNNPVEGTQLEEGLAVRFKIPRQSDGNSNSENPNTSNPNSSNPNSSSQNTETQNARNPNPATISLTDTVRGQVKFDLSVMEDFVIWRSNSTPTFLLANAIDDIDMGITHAIRGEDLLPSTPKALLIIDALGATRPTYAHLPLLVNEQRKKLSKRRDDVSVETWKDRGYLPEAITNYLATLGWGTSDDVEIRPMSEIVKLFRLADVNHSPAFFDPKKLEHFNSVHIRQLSKAEFLRKLEPWLEKASWPPERYRPEVLDTLGGAVQEKIRTLADVERFVDWLMLEEPPQDETSWDKAIKNNPFAKDILAGALSAYEQATWTTEELYAATKAVGEQLEIKLGKAQAPIRVAVTGRTVGPPLFESLVLLSREEVLRRIRQTIAKLE